MVLPHEAANKEKENLKIGHKRIDDANENLQSKDMKPRRVTSNQKSSPSNKRECNSCSAVLCHWEKWGEYLVEAGHFCWLPWLQQIFGELLDFSPVILARRSSISRTDSKKKAKDTSEPRPNPLLSGDSPMTQNELCLTHSDFHMS
jgi:hypothetical protein